MSRNSGSKLVKDFFAAAKTPFELVDNIQWQYNGARYQYMEAIEIALEKLFEAFYPQLTDLVKTVLVIYNGENEGEDYRISVLIGISDGMFDSKTATYLVAKIRINTVTDNVAHASIYYPGKPGQSFECKKGHWYV